jgi:hypothetical protein
MVRLAIGLPQAQDGSAFISAVRVAAHSLAT